MPHRPSWLLLAAAVALGCHDAGEPLAADVAANLTFAGRTPVTLEIPVRRGARGSSLQTPGTVSITPLQSLIGIDGFYVEFDSVALSVPGQFLPGRIRVTARLRLSSGLPDRALLAPSLPPPPEPDAIFLYPVNISAAEIRGGVAASNGNELLVEAPGAGSAQASVDWDGGPADYLRGGRCSLARPSCARYEPFSVPLLFGQPTAWRSIGFDIDPAVRRVIVRLLLAADVAR